MNQTQSFLLEERLKVLDCKKSQKNAEFDEEKYSLRKRMEEIKTVRKNWGISVERRKLLRSQGFTIDARAANSSDDPVAIKKYSMPELTGQRVSNKHNNDSIIKGLSQVNIHEAGETEKETVSGEQPKPDGARSRSRHQFRVIEPPCRPGSRRNFVQLSNDKLKELKEKEDKESEEALFDSTLKLDYRGMILSPKRVKSWRSNSQSEMDLGEKHLNMQLSESCEGCIPEKEIYRDKETVDVAYSLRPSSAPRVIPLCTEKQVCVESRDLEDKVLPKEQSRKLISKSCECLDRMTEVCAPDSISDCDDSVSSDVIRSSSPHTESTAVSRETRTAHSAHEPRRKHATYNNRPSVRLAFVEPQIETSNTDHHGLSKQGFEPTVQQERGAPIEMRDSHAEDVYSYREKPPQLQKKPVPVRRVTLPTKFFNGAPSQDFVKIQGDKIKEPKRLSVASYAPNVRRTKMTAFSSQPERGHSDNVITYAYDARPGRSLCKGYVTMQMTVKGKQVKVHIPKFPHDSDSQPVLDRVRKKAADD